MELKTLEELFDENIFDWELIKDAKDIMFITNSNPYDLWATIIIKYGKRTPLERYQNPDSFKKAVELIFSINNDKYLRLRESLDIKFNPVAPYDITEEKTSGNKQGNITTAPNLTRTVNNSETSFDNLDPKLTSINSQTDTGNSVTSVEHNISETFEDETFSGLSSSEKRKVRRVGNIGNTPQSDLLTKYREFSDFSIFDVIARDIISLTCNKFITGI